MLSYNSKVTTHALGVLSSYCLPLHCEKLFKQGNNIFFPAYEYEVYINNNK